MRFETAFVWRGRARHSRACPWCFAVYLLFLCGSCIGQNEGDAVSELALGIANQLLHVEGMNAILDQHIFRNNPQNGSEYIDLIARELTTRMEEMSDVLRQMQTAIQSTLSKYSADNYDTLGCDSLDGRDMKWKSRSFDSKLAGKKFAVVPNEKFLGQEVTRMMLPSIHLDPNGVDHLGSTYQERQFAASVCHSLELEKLFVGQETDVNKRAWTYFAFANGVFRQFPGTNYGDIEYYPLQRPWYAAGVGHYAVSKNVIFLLDDAYSAFANFESAGGFSGSDMSRILAAINVVFDQLSSLDYVSFVTIGEAKSFKATQMMMPATAQNILLFRTLLAGLTAGTHSHSNFTRGFESVFDLIHDSRMHPGFPTCSYAYKCQTLVLFFTNGYSHDSDVEQSVEWISKRAAEVDAHVFTFGIGPDVDRYLVEKIACSTGGVYQSASRGQDLRTSMQVLNHYVASIAHHIDSVQFSDAYFDEDGLGLMVTALLPCLDEHGTLFGVAATDIRLDDLLKQVSRLNFDGNYGMLFDAHTQALVHPLLLPPRDDDVGSTDFVTVLEGHHGVPAAEFAKFLSRAVLETSSSIRLKYTRAMPRGYYKGQPPVDFEGVVERVVEVEYQCRMILSGTPVHRFTACFVSLIGSDGELPYWTYDDTPNYDIRDFCTVNRPLARARSSVPDICRNLPVPDVLTMPCAACAKDVEEMTVRVRNDEPLVCMLRSCFSELDEPAVEFSRVVSHNGFILEISKMESISGAVFHTERLSQYIAADILHQSYYLRAAALSDGSVAMSWEKHPLHGDYGVVFSQAVHRNGSIPFVVSLEYEGDDFREKMDELLRASCTLDVDCYLVQASGHLLYSNNDPLEKIHAAAPPHSVGSKIPMQVVDKCLFDSLVGFVFEERMSSFHPFCPWYDFVSSVHTQPVSRPENVSAGLGWVFAAMVPGTNVLFLKAQKTVNCTQPARECRFSHETFDFNAAGIDAIYHRDVLDEADRIPFQMRVNSVCAMQTMDWVVLAIVLMLPLLSLLVMLFGNRLQRRWVKYLRNKLVLASIRSISASVIQRFHRRYTLKTRAPQLNSFHLALKKLVMRQNAHLSEQSWQTVCPYLAEIFLNDALRESDEVRTYKLSPGPLRVYWLQTATFYRRAMLTVAFAHVAMLVLESPRSEFNAVQLVPVSTLLLMEAALTLVHSLHLGLSLFSIGLVQYIRKPIRLFVFVSVLAIFVDTAIAIALYLQLGPAAVYSRWSRPLRGVMLICHSKALQNETRKLARCVPKILDLGALLLFFLGMFALMMVTIFRGIPNNGLFSTFGAAMETLYVFAGGENHPDVVALSWGEYRWIVAFLVLVYFVVGLVLMSYSTAIMFDTFVDAHRSIVQENRIIQKIALFSTFASLIDSTARNLLDYSAWKNVVQVVAPGTTEEQCQFLFGLVDVDNSGQLDLLEFFTMVDVFQVEIKTSSNQDEGLLNYFSQRVNAITLNRLVKLDSRIRSIRRFLKNAVLSETFRFCVITLIAINTTLTAMLSQLSWLSFTARFAVMGTMQQAIISFYVIETSFKLVGLGVTGYWADPWNRLDFSLVCLSLTIFVPPSTFKENPMLLTAFNILVVLRVLRLMKNIHRWRKVVGIFMRIMPVVVRVVVMLFILCYFYVTIGCSFLANRYVAGPYEPGFQQYGDAWLVFFQLLVGEGWNVIMQKGVWASSSDPRQLLQLFFFLSFHYVVGTMTVDLVIATFLEYTTKEQSTSARQAKHMHLLAKLMRKHALEGCKKDEKHIVRTRSLNLDKRNYAPSPAEELHELDRVGQQFGVNLVPMCRARLASLNQSVLESMDANPHNIWLKSINIAHTFGEPVTVEVPKIGRVQSARSRRPTHRVFHQTPPPSGRPGPARRDSVNTPWYRRRFDMFTGRGPHNVVYPTSERSTTFGRDATPPTPPKSSRRSAREPGSSTDEIHKAVMAITGTVAEVKQALEEGNLEDARGGKQAVHDSSVSEIGHALRDNATTVHGWNELNTLNSNDRSPSHSPRVLGHAQSPLASHRESEAESDRSGKIHLPPLGLDQISRPS